MCLCDSGEYPRARLQMCEEGFPFSPKCSAFHLTVPLIHGEVVSAGWLPGEG